MTSKDSLPFFDTVKSVDCYPSWAGTDHGSMVLVAHDPMAGNRARYSVLVINCQTGRTKCTGRELTLSQARRVAVQSAPSWTRKPSRLTMTARS
jgi:hypothetical protein